MVTLATQVVGGPVGRYAAVGRRGWAYVAAVLSSLASVLIALGVLQKNHCVRSGWSTPGSLWRECYSDLPVAVTGTEGSSPWAVGGAGHSQPVLTAVLTWALRHLVPSGTSLSQQQAYFAIGAVVIALLVAGTVAATALALEDTPWLAAHVALSPVLITAALISFDMLGVALMAGGLAAWARRKPVLAGVLLGAATMARSFPALVLVAIALVALREGQRSATVRLLVGALVTIGVVLGLAYAWGGDPLEVYGTWADQGPSYGSPWLVLQIMKVAIPAGPLTLITVIGWAVALMTGAYLATDRRRALPAAPVALLMVVIVMVTAKSLSVQAAVWVLPLVALSALRWRDHLLWAGAELIYFGGVWLYVGTSFDANKALPGPAYAVLVMLRLIALIGLAWAAVATHDELEDEREAADAIREPDGQRLVPLAGA